MSKRLRLAVLVSGAGTTLQNFIDSIAEGSLPAEICVVVASKSEAGGLERARRAGIPAVAIPRKQYADAHAFNDALHEVLSRYPIDLVLMAGFLSPFEIRGVYQGRVMNVHPALIPSFCGRGFFGQYVHRAALAAGVKISGCTVHFADDDYDHGPIILQGAVPVLDDDTEDSLAHRVHLLENQLYPEAVRLFAAGRLEIVGNRVRIRPDETAIKP